MRGAQKICDPPGEDVIVKRRQNFKLKVSGLK